MKIIAHRGYWLIDDEKNTELAFERALRANFGIETDLRKSLVKSRLGQVTECQLAEVRLPRSDSIDSMLGDSLLDPPQVINKVKKEYKKYLMLSPASHITTKPLNPINIDVPKSG